MAKETTTQSQATPTNGNVALASVSVTVPPLTDKELAAKAAVEHHRAYKIDCVDLYLHVDKELTKVKTLLKNFERERDAFCEPFVNIRREALAGKNLIENKYAPVITYLQTSEQLLKGEMARWNSEQERLRQEEERRVRAIQEEERRRLEAEAEAERQKALDAIRKQQEEAHAAMLAGKRAEADALIVRAADMSMQATRENAERMEAAEAITAQPTHVATITPKLKGTSFPTTYHAEVADLKEVLRGMVEGATSLDGVTLNMPWFNKEATRLKDAGVENFYRGMKVVKRNDVRKVV